MPDRGYDRRSDRKERRARSRSPGSERSRSPRRRRRDRSKDGKVRRNGEGGEEYKGRRRERSADTRARSGETERRGDRQEVDAKPEAFKRNGPLPPQADSFALVKAEEEGVKPKETANFGNTGLLAAASKSVSQGDGTTIVLKYHEPPEARKPPPRDHWKLFVFKGPDIVDTIELSYRSCWLVGREAAVVDLLAEHPSTSKQHAVIQFRYTEKRNEFGDKIGRVKPYLIDLESANGTLLNKEKVPDSRYLELRDKDMIQFGLSTREYVLMLDRSD